MPCAPTYSKILAESADQDAGVGILDPIQRSVEHRDTDSLK